MSTLSRVVPGTSETIMRSSWSSAFTSDDLPTFTRPAMARCRTGGGIFTGVVGPGGSRRASSASTARRPVPSCAETAMGSP